MKHDPCPDPQSLSLCIQHAHLSSNIHITHARFVITSHSKRWWYERKTPLADYYEELWPLF